LDLFLAFTNKIAIANLNYIYPSGFGDDEWIVNSDTLDSEVAILL
jgi:hypothetical protein